MAESTSLASNPGAHPATARAGIPARSGDGASGSRLHFPGIRSLRALILCLLAFPVAGCGDRGKEEMHKLWSKLFQADLRPLDEEAVALRRELRGLPMIFPSQQSSRIGYHSQLTITRREGVLRRDARYIVLDLGKRQRIDSIVLVPADFAIDRNPGPGYGFPVRWRVEAADEPGFSEPTVLVDHTGVDFPNPGSFPVVVPAEDLEARYIRLTATRPFSHSNRNLLALGEIMVLQGNRNLAAGLPPEAIRGSESDESPPRWSKANLVDGQSILGAPVGVIQARSEGFQSSAAAHADTTKWVQIDLGREAVLQEVRLLPARAGEYPARRGFGFPLRYKVEVSREPDFREPVVVASFLEEDVVSPCENPVSLPVPDVTARYVRLTAVRLAERNDDYVLAMAEMEVYSEGRNIALHAPVTVPDSDSRETGIWSTRFLTDGFNSQRNILEWPEWFAGLERRRWIEARMAELEGLRAETMEASIRRFTFWTMVIIGGVMVLAGFAIWRNRRTRIRDLEMLRQRIARDVHDEIGSGLGTIALLSQMAGANDANPPRVREEFREIHNLSRQITESLRDIVWFIRPETRTVGDLAQRLRETAASMLAAVPHEFHVDPAAMRRSLPLEFKRHVLLVFKEALHNLMRHSQATHATIQVGGTPKSFTLEVRDNGTGFDVSGPSSGAGLTGMLQRAETLGGTLTITSEPGSGTTLRLDVPWP